MPDLLFRSPRTIYGKCVIHGRAIASDELCPECRVQDDLTHGDYLWAHGVLRLDDKPLTRDKAS